MNKLIFTASMDDFGTKILLISSYCLCLSANERRSLSVERNECVKLNCFDVFRIGTTEFIVMDWFGESEEAQCKRKADNEATVNMLLRVPALRALSRSQLHDVVRFGTFCELNASDMKPNTELTDDNIPCFVLVQTGEIDFRGKKYKNGEYFGEQNMFCA